MTQRLTIQRIARGMICDGHVVLLAAALLIAGCGEGTSQYPRGAAIRTDPAAPSGAVVGNSAVPAQVPDSTGVNYFGSSNDSQRLEKLWQERANAKPFSDFPIGPGDEIVMILPSVKELSDDAVVVSATGDINLPLVGQIHANGMTEQQLREQMRRRLLKFMYDPQFQLFVKKYRSRQIAVLGAVPKPGVFTLTGPSETVLEAISLAGGPTSWAADRVVLIPGTPWERAPNPEAIAAAVSMTNPGSHGTTIETTDGESGPDSDAVASVQEISAPDAQPSVPPGTGTRAPFRGLNGQPLVMALRSDSSAGSARFLNMPLRPGDVLVVPDAGQVAVVGWVNNPGSFKISTGFSALSAIGAAGGPMYAADQSDVHILRIKNSGVTESIHLNLDKIKRGEEPDVPVQGNDVIEVGYSKAKIGPYIVYSILNNKIGAGVGIPVY